MRTLLFLLLAGLPFMARCQTTDSVTCADVRNGTFFEYDRRTENWTTVVRKGTLQKETFGKGKAPVLWEVTWQGDCAYSLKYLSGGDDAPDAEKKYRNKHTIVTQILKTTPDYLVFRCAADKATNPDILMDTLWIKIRQADKGKPVTNPGADSLVAARRKIQDSIAATYATLYIYRPSKFLNALMTYNLMIDDQPVCVISNGCRITMKLKKPGTFHISAKVNGREEAVTLNAEPRGVYYLQCEAVWGLRSDPVLILEDPVKGKAAFNGAQ